MADLFTDIADPGSAQLALRFLEKRLPAESKAAENYDMGYCRQFRV
jgi:hypothetical protein